MANRYKYTNIIKESDTNKNYFDSTIYPIIKPSDNDFYVISEAGDRLDLLAKKFYNDTTYWWIIAVANNLNDANFFVPEGLQLRIPTNPILIMNELKKVNE
jgi:hypothetical protein